MSRAVIAEAVLKNVLFFFGQYKTQTRRGSYFLQRVFACSLFPQAWFPKEHVQCKETGRSYKNQSQDIDQTHQQQTTIEGRSLQTVRESISLQLLGGTRGKYFTSFVYIFVWWYSFVVQFLKY